MEGQFSARLAISRNSDGKQEVDGKSEIFGGFNRLLTIRPAKSAHLGWRNPPIPQSEARAGHADF
jgi:hypothetical protein